MNTIDNGGPAFPQHGWSKDPDVRKYMQQSGNLGMTLRDYFAAKAMQGIIACPTARNMHAQECADLSYEMADAMLKARGL